MKERPNPIKDATVLILSGALVILVAAVVAAAFFMPPKPLAGSAVKVIVKAESGAVAGHGSGVVISDSYIITAAHVVAGISNGADIRFDDGRTAHADVLWQNPDYDVALLRFTITPADISSANLICRTPGVGEAVYTVGNPLSNDFLTQWGHVSGTPRRAGDWPIIVHLDMTVAPGNSGGPLFDDRGNVVGIVVGMLLMPGFTGGSPLAISTAVPASVVCMLMARA